LQFKFNCTLIAHAKSSATAPEQKLVMLCCYNFTFLFFSFTIAADIDAVAILQCKRQEKDGKEHLAVKNLKIEFHIGSLSIHLSDLFGNKELSK
jgi:Haemolymph juvenile hormone binding protein (JHBP)